MSDIWTKNAESYPITILEQGIGPGHYVGIIHVLDVSQIIQCCRMVTAERGTAEVNARLSAIEPEVPGIFHPTTVIDGIFRQEELESIILVGITRLPSAPHQDIRGGRGPAHQVVIIVRTTIIIG